MNDANCYILPFELNVEMKVYHNKAFPLGSIKANIKEYDTWLCNKLINCVYVPDEDAFNSYEVDLWSVKDGLTFDQSLFLSPETFGYNGMNLIELNKSMIKQEYYITGMYNEFYIPEKPSYQKYNFNHDYILFGFDDGARVFKSAAYLKERIYGFYDIPYDAYFHSIIENNVKKVPIKYHKVNKNYIPQINIKVIKEKLENYLFSRVDARNSKLKRIYGIEAWDCLAEYVSTHESLDLRFSRVFMEHRGIMCKRIHKLWECSYISNGNIEERYYNKIYLRAQGIHNMFIKYNLTRREDLLTQISKLILEINAQEREILKDLVNQIQL